MLILYPDLPIKRIVFGVSTENNCRFRESPRGPLFFVSFVASVAKMEESHEHRCHLTGASPSRPCLLACGGHDDTASLVMMPRIVQQLIAAVLVSIIASPAWTESQVAGAVVASQSATMASMPVPPGSTLFSGEGISVDERGSAQIALVGGGRLEVLHDSAVQLNLGATGVQFTVVRGGVSFTGGPKNSVETIFGDATIRLADASSVGVLHVENADSAVLAAIKGKLAIRTEHDAKLIELPEGSAARITLVDDPNSEPQGGAQPAGKAAPALRKLALIVILVGALFLGAFLWIAAHEPSETPSQLGAEISPFKLQ